MNANTAALQPNNSSVSAHTGSPGASGKHPHTVYSHCNERMLFIMKKEDGSSLRRTHPHITRSVKKGLVVIVANPACALSLAIFISLKMLSEFNHQKSQSIEFYSQLNTKISSFKCVAVYRTASPSIITPIIFGNSYVVAV